MQQVNNDNNITISDFKVNGTYTNKDIVTAFRCSPQGGMRRAIKTNTLVLFVLHNKPLYEDKWDGDILNYTGMGQRGDQSQYSAQNRTLLESNENGITVHLFESYKDKEYRYDGIVKLVGDIFFDDEPDIDGNMRKVVKFPLKKISTDEIVVDIDDINESNEQKEKELKKYSDIEIKKLAKQAGKKNPKKTTATTTAIERDPAIAEHTKRRAKGKCDLCGNDAPFKSKGEPYLECHHVIQLAKDGPDAYYNTVALCPNCHRKVHIVNSKNDFNFLKNKIKSYLEADNDVESLQAFKELFGD